MVLARAAAPTFGSVDGQLHCVFLFWACMRVLFIRSLNTAYAVEIGAMYHYDLQHALPRILSSLHLGEILSQIYEVTRNLALDC
jgi:hypothetical protein